MKKLVNTAREGLYGLAALLRIREMGGSKAIEEQEARGQAGFIESNVLPKEIQGEGGKKVLESFGVVFHGLVEGDPLFQYVTLPPGWRKEATEHSMWSRLIDDKGCGRAMIFYKASFYDRSAFLRVLPLKEVST